MLIAIGAFGQPSGTATGAAGARSFVAAYAAWAIVMLALAFGLLVTKMGWP